MGNSKKRKKKKKVGYNSLGMIAIALVVLVLLGGLMLESNDLKERLTGYDAKAATLQQQIEDEQTRTEEIDKLKKYMETDEYAEEVAREKLGLVKAMRLFLRNSSNKCRKLLRRIRLRLTDISETLPYNICNCLVLCEREDC